MLQLYGVTYVIFLVGDLQLPFYSFQQILMSVHARIAVAGKLSGISR